MSILDSIKNQLGMKPTANEFYRDSKVEKVEWRLSSCHEYPDLYWARLRRFSNDKADVLFQDDDKIYGFDSAEFAGYYISEDEFSPFDESFEAEDRNFIEIPKETEIQKPDWENKKVNNFEYIGKY